MKTEAAKILIAIGKKTVADFNSEWSKSVFKQF